MVLVKMEEAAVVASRKFIFLFLFLILLETKAIASSKVGFIVNTLIQRGDSGNQVFDDSGNQDMEVYEPIFFLDYQIDKNNAISLSALIDSWSSASEGIFDTYTGASLNPDRSLASTVYQERRAIYLSSSHDLDFIKISPSLGYSHEFDYESIGGGLTLEKSFAQDNFTVAAGYNYYHDQVNDWDVNQGKFTGFEKKRTHTFSASATQLISPSDAITFGYSYTRQSGHLAATINSVNLLGVRVDEVLPETRHRHSAGAHYVHGFTDNLAGHLSYNFYIDSWGMKAHAVEPAAHISLAEEAILLRLSYRLYTQNAAEYYQDGFNQAQVYMTSDSDLDDFFAHQFGLQGSYTWELENTYHMDNIEIGAGIVYYQRTNDLWILVNQIGLSIGF